LALAQGIGISRTPVREAIGRLVAERLGSGRARLDENEMQRFLAADMKFHMLLLRAAGNLRIMKVVADTRLLTRIFSYRREGHDAALLEQIHQYHHDVLEAVEAGDAARAMERLGEHIRASMRERLETYERWTRENELRRLMPAPWEELERWEPIQGDGNREGES
jgi:DNA-binding GntR family transcriptional regulator